MWLEVTGRCQLRCVHCYADSGPDGTHGPMTVADWERVIDEGARLGVSMVQFIGGEPTLHPALAALVDHALALDLEVEVFTNLVHMSPRLWETFSRPGVRLATSWYSDDPAEHAAITRRNTYAHTRKNIAEAVRRSIPLRVGIIDMLEGQRIEEAIAELRGLGVTDIGSDRLRQVGRGVRELQASPDQLCGHCADGLLAVSPSGEVWPCVFARWMSVGNVLEQSLADVLVGPRVEQARAELGDHFAQRRDSACVPHCHPDCPPSPCQPTCPPRCSPGCQPCKPNGCWPYYR